MSSKLIVTDKMLDVIQLALRDSTYMLAMEGSIRSIKTTTEIQLLHFLVYQSEATFHLIACHDMSFINEVILSSEVGLITLYPNIYKLKKDEIGGYYIEARYSDSNVKKILLCGFDNKARWKKINGHSFGVIICDEINTANQTFIDEAVARQSSISNPKFIMTLNGDSPSHFIYQNYINYCKILGKAPASTVAEHSKFPKKKGYYYIHFTFYDNPIMTEEKIERTKNLYPVGSYYYKIKILGERGTSGSLIFNDYLNEEKHLIDLTNIIYKKFTIGVDIGANRAENSMTLIGWRSRYEFDFIDNISFKQLGYDLKRVKFKNQILTWQKQYGNIECVSIDCAEKNFIADFKSEMIKEKITVIASYKATIKDRIDLLIVSLSLGLCHFNNATTGGNDLFKAYQMAKWADDKIGKEREDNNDPINDKMDSAEYALTVHMTEVLTAIKNIRSY